MHRDAMPLYDEPVVRILCVFGNQKRLSEDWINSYIARLLTAFFPALITPFYIVNMADNQTIPSLGQDLFRSLSQKKLPIPPRRARLQVWIVHCSRRILHGWWAWELIAASASVLPMVAVIVVLAEANQHPQQNWVIGNTQLTINAIIAALGTMARSSLLVAVAGALNQSAWNWFSSKTGIVETQGHPLKDLETFSEAAANSWNCVKLLWRTKGRYVSKSLIQSSKRKH